MSDKYFYLQRDWRKVRKQALERDNYTCQSCGNPYPHYLYSKNGPRLVVHHKTPRSKGGADALENAETLCTICHGRKHKEL